MWLSRLSSGKPRLIRCIAIAKPVPPRSQTIPSLVSKPTPVVKEVVLSEPDAEALAEEAVVWASQHGLVVAKRNPVPDATVVHTPLSLLPAEYPRSCFEQAKAAQPFFNALVDAVASDEVYLQETLAVAAQHDDFTARLLQLLHYTRQARVSQASTQVVLGVHRCDYMLDEPSGKLLQVEINTISCGLPSLSALTSRLHRYLVHKFPNIGMDVANVPSNSGIDEVPAAMAAAVSAFDRQGAVVVMVVQKPEWNMYDQQWLQFQLWDRYGIRVVRATLAEVADSAQVQSDGTMTMPVPGMDERAPVALFYFRAGYTPKDYPSDKEWRAREIIESCTAAKCPTVAYQLAGAKKIQQDLAMNLERFVGDATHAQLLHSFFAGLWPLDNLDAPGVREVVADAIANPSDYVLKPQREGGGNNLYGDAMAAVLQAGGPPCGAYILMQRMKPQTQGAYALQGGQVSHWQGVSELGIYGTFVKKGNKVLLNREAGHLVRTKSAASNEGGLSIGTAVINSPYLTAQCPTPEVSPCCVVTSCDSVLCGKLGV